MFTALLSSLACTAPMKDAASRDTEAAQNSADTAACLYSTAYQDECCWNGRAESRVDRLVDTKPVLDAWTGLLPGATILHSQTDLTAWWSATGTTGNTTIDFTTEVAVGFIGESSVGCHEVYIDGFRAGDQPDTWYVGLLSAKYCGYFEGCTDYVAHASLYAAPLGAVSVCRRSGVCDG